MAYLMCNALTVTILFSLSAFEAGTSTLDVQNELTAIKHVLLKLKDEVHQRDETITTMKMKLNVLEQHELDSASKVSQLKILLVNKTHQLSSLQADFTKILDLRQQFQQLINLPSTVQNLVHQVSQLVKLQTSVQSLQTQVQNLTNNILNLQNSGVATSGKQCSDSTAFNCATLDAAGNLCDAMVYIAAHSCRKYCNLC